MTQHKKLKRVGVLTFSNVGNFGDRLGMHLLSSVLPSNGIVERLYFHPWNARQDAEYDLLIIGIGNSLFAPLLHQPLLRLIEQSKHAIGIFGTQYREEFSKDSLLAVIERLDYWFARYQSDIDYYQARSEHVIHLGDWLIREFVSTMPTIHDKQLNIGDEVLRDLPLDRTIQNIQSYAKVHSSRLHPLLCALTSASIVSYTEQRGRETGHVSGKFEALLLDIFGQAFPENTPWHVNRVAVMNYRDAVITRIDYLRSVLAKILESE